LYGINPLDPDDVHSTNLCDLKPVLSLHSTITKIIELKKGEKVSYNGVFEAKEDTKIAVLPLGYYEGFDRILSNQTQVKHINETENSQKINFVRVAGRICMNHTMIELGELPAKYGDEVIIYSKHSLDANSLQNLWKTYQLFPYSALVHINENIRRVTI
jgi:alanine racemase